MGCFHLLSLVNNYADSKSVYLFILFSMWYHFPVVEERSLNHCSTREVPKMFSLHQLNQQIVAKFPPVTWSVADLQCCVSFRCRAKWFRTTELPGKSPVNKFKFILYHFCVVIDHLKQASTCHSSSRYKKISQDIMTLKKKKKICVSYIF